MDDVRGAFEAAFTLLVAFDDRLVEIVALSLRVSLSAVLIAALLGLPLGAVLALQRFPGRRLVIVGLNVLMGLPPVVVGLVVYLLLSRAGPLGVFGLLFTPTAMIAAQVVLVLPIVASLTRQVVESLWEEYRETFRSLAVPPALALRALLWDARFALVTALLAGFGRAIAEVGAVMIVGGNIDHVTRVMTTAIALEVSKGDLALALGLGIVLILLSLAVNIAAYGLKEVTEARSAA
ncbi:MAG: ABC transporter permease [Alphaproteobacteria bacterium]|jgi:tungstate transport system permease protein|nr:ABC transporter permease [Alphaproteobacteria bacterium]